MSLLYIPPFHHKRLLLVFHTEQVLNITLFMSVSCYYYCRSSLSLCMISRHRQRRDPTGLPSPPNSLEFFHTFINSSPVLWPRGPRNWVKGQRILRLIGKWHRNTAMNGILKRAKPIIFVLVSFQRDERGRCVGRSYTDWV